MDPGSIFIGSGVFFFFYAMLSCSPKRMRDGGASELRKGGVDQDRRAVTRSPFFAFTSEVNFHACALRT